MMKYYSLILSFLLLVTNCFCEEVAIGSPQSKTANDNVTILYKNERDDEAVTYQNNTIIRTSKTHRTTNKEIKCICVESGPSSTKIKCNFIRYNTITKKEDEKGVENIAPISGKIYLITIKDGDEKITDEKGETVTPIEEKLLKEEGLGRSSSFYKFICGKTFKVGEVVHIPDDLCEKLFNQAKLLNIKMKDYSIVLTALAMINDKKCAVFDIEYKSTDSINGLIISYLHKNRNTIEIDAVRGVSVEANSTAEGIKEDVGNQSKTNIKGSSKTSITFKYGREE